MAGRPKKTRLDYFPFSVDLFDDEKIVCVSAECGMVGELTAVKLLCAIYRNGYYIRWTEAMRFKTLRQCPGLEAEMLDKIILSLIKWEFFDREMFEKENVLTSRAIQRRYFEIMKRCVGECDYEYLLLDPAGIAGKKQASRKAKQVQKTAQQPAEQPVAHESAEPSESTPEPPTAAEVVEYFSTHADRPDEWRRQAQLFHSHYAASGWRTANGSPIANWQSKADYWLLKEKEKALTQPATPYDPYARRRGVEPTTKSRAGFRGTFV